MFSASVSDVGSLEVGGGNCDCGELSFLSGDDRQFGDLKKIREIQYDELARTKRQQEMLH
jgi:hypothetical protein